MSSSSWFLRYSHITVAPTLFLSKSLICWRVDDNPLLMFSQLAFLYSGILHGFCILFLVVISISEKTISWSEIPGIVSVLVNVDGLLVRMRSKMFSPLVSSSTIWVRLLSSSISLNLVWILGYAVLSFNVLVFHSHPGRLKSPAIIMLDVAFLLNLFKLFSNLSRDYSFEVLGL